MVIHVLKFQHFMAEQYSMEKMLIFLNMKYLVHDGLG